MRLCTACISFGSFVPACFLCPHLALCARYTLSPMRPAHTPSSFHLFGFLCTHPFLCTAAMLLASLRACFPLMRCTRRLFCLASFACMIPCARALARHMFSHALCIASIIFWLSHACFLSASCFMPAASFSCAMHCHIFSSYACILLATLLHVVLPLFCSTHARTSFHMLSQHRKFSSYTLVLHVFFRVAHPFRVHALFHASRSSCTRAFLAFGASLLFHLPSLRHHLLHATRCPRSAPARECCYIGDLGCCARHVSSCIPLPCCLIIWLLLRTFLG